MSDLRERIEKAINTLETLLDKARHERHAELGVARLSGKIEGLRLVLDYLRTEVIDDINRQLIEWERLGVKVWEDCPVNGQPVGDYGGQWWCDDGCSNCGGSGKALAEGVEYFEGASLGDGYWLPAHLIDGEDT